MPLEGLQDLVDDLAVGQRRPAHHPVRRAAVGVGYRSFEEAVRRLDTDDQPVSPMLACALVSHVREAVKAISQTISSRRPTMVGGHPRRWIRDKPS